MLDHVIRSQAESHGWPGAAIDRRMRHCLPAMRIIHPVQRHGCRHHRGQRYDHAVILRRAQRDLAGHDHYLGLVEAGGQAFMNGGSASGIQDRANDLRRRSERGPGMQQRVGWQAGGIGGALQSVPYRLGHDQVIMGQAVGRMKPAWIQAATPHPG